jgi:hypothetical protein
MNVIVITALETLGTEKICKTSIIRGTLRFTLRHVDDEKFSSCVNLRTLLYDMGLVNFFSPKSFQKGSVSNN